MTATDTQFINRALANIRELEDESDHLDATIRGLEERRRSLTLRIQGAKEALRYFDSVMGRDGPAPDLLFQQGSTMTVVEVKTATPSSRHRISTGTTVAEMSAHYMARHGGEADVSDLASHLIDVGRYTPERRRQAYRLITAILLRDRRFRRVSPGRYGLTDRPVAATTTGATDRPILVAQEIVRKEGS